MTLWSADQLALRTVFQCVSGLLRAGRRTRGAQQTGGHMNPWMWSSGDDLRPFKLCCSNSKSQTDVPDRENDNNMNRLTIRVKMTSYSMSSAADIVPGSEPPGV